MKQLKNAFKTMRNNYFGTRDAWKLSTMSDVEFMARYQHEITKLELGCSFSIARWEECNTGLSSIDCLRYIVETLGIREIRLGLWWDKICPSPEVFELGVYKDILEYCFTHKVAICLNIGPIKSLGWPEEHVPEWVLEGLQTPPIKKMTITPESELGQLALKYTERLLIELRQKFSVEQLSQIKIIQPENEGFNVFGNWGWTMSFEYLNALVVLVSKYLPERVILSNSAGRFQLKRIMEWFGSAGYTKLRLQSRIGFDYYYTNDMVSQYRLARFLDAINVALPLDVSAGGLLKQVARGTMALEITEAQMEPWGRADSPGNKLGDLKFMLIRLMTTFLVPQADSGLLVRLWGVERLAAIMLTGQNTYQHEQIVILIRDIQSRKT